MTSHKEDYLKAIYELSEGTSWVTNSALAQRLAVSNSSVSEMVPKLCSMGWVTYRPYHGVALTPAGKATCEALMRNSRLWEVFLTQTLGLGWRAAYEQAHLLEHATSAEVADALDRFLGFPKTCPHGNPIPRGGEGQIAALVPLAVMERGQGGTVRRIEEDLQLLDYLQALGLKLGEDIVVLSKGELEGPLLVAQGEHEMMLSFRAARGVYLERKDEE